MACTTDEWSDGDCSGRVGDNSQIEGARDRLDALVDPVHGPHPSPTCQDLASQTRTRGIVPVVGGGYVEGGKIDEVLAIVDVDGGKLEPVHPVLGLVREGVGHTRVTIGHVFVFCECGELPHT